MIGVIEASNGNDALELMKAREVDLVFSDIVMPGMSGLDLARQIRETDSGVPVLLASGYSGRQFIQGRARDALDCIFVACIARRTITAGETSDGSLWVRPPGGIAALEGGMTDQPFGMPNSAQDPVSSESALREAARRLDAIINNTTMALFVMDERQHCVFMNKAAEELTGYRFEETTGRPLHDVIHSRYPDGRHYPLEECPIDRAFPERNQMQGEELFVHKNGSFYPVAFTASPIRDDDGRPVGTIIEARAIAEEKARQAALHETEERYRLAAKATTDAIWDWDLASDHIAWNEAVQELFGYATHEVGPSGAWWKAQIHPEDRERVVTGIQAVIDGAEERWTDEYRFRRADGSYAHVLDRGQVIRDAKGRAVRMVGAMLDLSEQKEAEQALRLGEERLRVAQAAGGIGTFELLPATGRIIVSEQFCRLWGVPPIEETDVSYFLDLIHPDDRERVYTGRSTLPERALEYIEYRIVRPDTGETRWMARKGEAFEDAAAGRTRYFGVSYDITDRKVVEDALVSETRNLETLNRTGAATAAELDLERVVQLVTDAGVELTGAKFGAFFYNVLNDAGESYMLYTLSGAERSQFDFGMPRATAVFKPTVMGEGVIRSDDITADPRYGLSAPHHGMPKGHLPVRSYLAVPVQSRSGEVIGGLFFGHPEPGRFTDRHERLMVGIAGQAAVAIDNARLYQSAQRELAQRRAAETALRELNETLEQRVRTAIAERERAEEALRQSQKMEAVGQLTGGLAHDFNNLLTVVTGNVDMAGRSLDAAGVHDPRARRALDSAMKGAERAASLTQRLLAFSRRQPLAPKALDVDKLVLGMSDLLNRSLGETVKLEIVTSPGLWRVEADPNQLESAILNLAVNARDAMPAGGELVVETANARLDEEYCATHAEVAPGQYVVIAVTDTGEGMPKHVQDRVFEPFFTTKEVGKGTGLGLSMVYGFVKQSGGHVKIYSEVGQGTTIKIYLPRLVSESAVEDEAQLTHGLEISRRAETILVVEDDDDVRAYTVECLRELGYRVLEAHDGPSALRLLERQEHPVDLLFTDVVMPGMSGRELADAARDKQPGLKVLYTSGYTRNAIVHGGRLDPGVEMIAKPFTYAALAQKVSDVLDTGGGRVLVVEGEPTVRALAIDALTAAGYSAEEAANASEALGKVRSAQGRFGAVFIDDVLPDRAGDTLVAELRTLYADLPILLTTAGREAMLRERFAGDRCTGVVGKPYSAAKLTEALRLVGVRCSRG